MPIRLLSQQVAELIAAGEVVERPSSVVKELCENAIDAGAGNIMVEIVGGGIALIRVQDDGGGVAAEDIPLAFARHATSKLHSADELDSIHTLGFRGEALASIASVAKVELLTKTEQDEFASLYRVQGGQQAGELQPAARAVGTTIAVTELFYNTPARMKFLKKDASEGTFVSEIVTRLALSHPEIAFTYLRDGKQMFASAGDGKLQSAAYAVLGSDFARALIDVAGSQGQYTVNGLVTPPKAARASRSMQFFFINGRYVKNRTMMAALEQAYKGTVMHGKFPGALLFLQMPPELVDVNVHPAKTEVRFAKESDVFSAVYRAVKSALVEDFDNYKELALPEAAGRGQADVPADAPPDMAARDNAAAVAGAGAAPTAQQIAAYNGLVDTVASAPDVVPYETAGPPQPQRYAQAPRQEERVQIEEQAPVGPGRFWQRQADDDALTELGQQTELDGVAQQPQPFRVVGEIFSTYILGTMGNSLCLIDKHAAHERLLYEKLAAQREEPSVQMLLQPVNVTLSAGEKNALLQNKELLERTGVQLEDFGANSVLVRGIPADTEGVDAEDLVVELADRLIHNAKDATDKKTEWVLHSIACRAAVKAGDKTDAGQLYALANDILQQKVPPFCPHGRPVVLEITRKELEKQFGRA